MRIAYVEDNPTNLALVERIARMTSHAIVSYTEGEIALVKLKEEKFDLILMDVELAGAINGLEVVRRLRAHGLETPIVAVTAYAMMGDRDKCLAAGCNEYLPKPLPINDFIQLLGRYDALLKQKAAKTGPLAVPGAAAASVATAVPMAGTSEPVKPADPAPVPATPMAVTPEPAKPVDPAPAPVPATPVAVTSEPAKPVDPALVPAAPMAVTPEPAKPVVENVSKAVEPVTMPDLPAEVKPIMPPADSSSGGASAVASTGQPKP
jgi:CheY-like chemotaxis protein